MCSCVRLGCGAPSGSLNLCKCFPWLVGCREWPLDGPGMKYKRHRASGPSEGHSLGAAHLRRASRRRQSHARSRSKQTANKQQQQQLPVAPVVLGGLSGLGAPTGRFPSIKLARALQWRKSVCQVRLRAQSIQIALDRVSNLDAPLNTRAIVLPRRVLSCLGASGRPGGSAVRRRHRWRQRQWQNAWALTLAKAFSQTVESESECEQRLSFVC